MNRRTALFSTLLLGGLLPGRLLAQSRAPATKGARKPAATGDAARSTRRGGASDEQAEPLPAADEAAKAPAGAAADESPPADFPNEPGQQWRNFDITRYTSLPHNQQTPQTALVEWIFRRTESAPWHGDKIAVLSASRTQLRAYNSPKILSQVEKMVERFTDAEFDFLSVRVRFVAAADTRWRWTVNSKLNLLGSGPQGQQIWTLKVEDSAMVMSQMQIYQGFKLLADQKVEMINGQTLTVETTTSQNYVSNLQRENAVGLGFQPGVQQLKEGVVLRISPLLTYEADTLDAAIELKANTIKALHKTKVIAPREIGPAEMTIDVPEVVESRLNQTVQQWPLGQTLLISAGIQPGILQSKGGFMNLRIPGTVPTGTELLVFLDAEARGG
ncbi:MAG TPA: hypothetical protein VGZ22_28910, partial [Isosphaeraceae bacterium]|nr:hypothetical protein [Isosphaeraceae bacterium]